MATSLVHSLVRDAIPHPAFRALRAPCWRADDRPAQRQSAPSPPAAGHPPTARPELLYRRHSHERRGQRSAPGMLALHLHARAGLSMMCTPRGRVVLAHPPANAQCRAEPGMHDGVHWNHRTGLLLRYRGGVRGARRRRRAVVEGPWCDSRKLGGLPGYWSGGSVTAWRVCAVPFACPTTRQPPSSFPCEPRPERADGAPRNLGSCCLGFRSRIGKRDTAFLASAHRENGEHDGCLEETR